MTELKTYNKFVEYYDEIIRGNGYDLDSEVSFLDEVIKNNYKPHHNPPLTGEGKKNINILEFACGTGTIARELAKKGYSIFGVDLSEQMIEKARIGQTQGLPLQKIRRGEPCVHPLSDFQVGDMTSIHLNKEFDIVLCNYNSVCHLNSWKDWQKFFKNSYRHLKKGGILVFDILTIFEFENITRDFRGFFNVKGDTICLEMFKEPNILHFEKRGDAGKAERIYDGVNIYKWLIKMFVNSGKNTFELVEEEIKEISFPVEDIKKELEKTGFTIKHLEDFHFGELTDESERVYFVAEK